MTGQWDFVNGVGLISECEKDFCFLLDARYILDIKFDGKVNNDFGFHKEFEI